LPDGSQIFPVYNEANLLNSMNVFINGKTVTPVPFIDNIDYNAKGQRVSINYSNKTLTAYTYDEQTYRLTQLRTTRKKVKDTDPENAAIEPLQELNYTYDPVGNITGIIDHAQQTNFFNNSKIDPGNDYVYDALYRLTSATGREYCIQSAVEQFDSARTGDANGPFTIKGDMSKMANYTQSYSYDEVGNMLTMSHNGGNKNAINQWTRTFEYNNNDTHRALNGVAGTKNNQLLNEWTGNARPPGAAPKYFFDGNGNMLNLQQGSFPLTWNYANQLRQVNLIGGGIAYYTYDAGGQRVRKVIETNGLVKDRKYLGNYEVYTEKQNGNLKLERETLHIIDDKSRIALVEIRSPDTKDNGTDFLIRYQYSNHLGTSCLELTGTMNVEDDSFNPQIISYEEYYPFGSTAYQEMDNENETPKRYRYTGKERDEESGLNYHSARYYLPWLGRWIATDPGGIIDGLNMYRYCKNNSICFSDVNGRETGIAYENYKNTPDYKSFEAMVGSSKDLSPPPKTLFEKKEDQDILTKEHDEATKKVINAALEISTKHYTDPVTNKLTATKQEIIDYALHKLIIPLRQRSEEDSQNLIFRDADHYIVGWNQYWQTSSPWPFRLEKKHGELSIFSGVAAYVYDKIKTWSNTLKSWSESKDSSTDLDRSTMPAAAAGGRDWVDLGTTHFNRDEESMSKVEAPALVVETPFEIREGLREEQWKAYMKEGPRFPPISVMYKL
jgi:RHS repeat-associated protein